jgi:D-tyrosyl-tRNA(Tyr) deacylase
MSGDEAKEMYEKVLASLGKQYDPEKVKDGVFGALMQVNIVNEGPVTIELDSNNK